VCYLVVPLLPGCVPSIARIFPCFSSRVGISLSAASLPSYEHLQNFVGNQVFLSCLNFHVWQKTIIVTKATVSVRRGEQIAKLGKALSLLLLKDHTN